MAVKKPTFIEGLTSLSPCSHVPLQLGRALAWIKAPLAGAINQMNLRLFKSSGENSSLRSMFRVNFAWLNSNWLAPNHDCQALRVVPAGWSMGDRQLQVKLEKYPAIDPAYPSCPPLSITPISLLLLHGTRATALIRQMRRNLSRGDLSWWSVCQSLAGPTRSSSPCPPC